MLHKIRSPLWFCWCVCACVTVGERIQRNRSPKLGTESYDVLKPNVYLLHARHDRCCSHQKRDEPCSKETESRMMTGSADVDRLILWISQIKRIMCSAVSRQKHLKQKSLHASKSEKYAINQDFGKNDHVNTMGKRRGVSAFGVPC